ncbi:MAG: DUF4367 domain-containing protein [Oscillibacter sp.]|jgi:hypothetical protein|nr:DUF4367 domain-containing protein [uncultured Oscillibacter sp.]MCI9644368.1 DUF4367 domain-containing protein [Oscillibacter sp.]
MTQRERLVEQYEDALFALLMEDVMVREGERLEAWNRRLLEDPAAAVPESLDLRCRKAIGRCASARKRQAALRRTGKILRAAAVIAAIIGTLFTTAFAASEEFREAALELARTVTGHYTQLDIRRTVETGGRTLGEYFKRVDVGWLPEGFSYRGGEYDAWAEFEDGQGGSLRVEAYPENTYLDLRLENPDRSEGLSINGNSGMLWEKDGETVLSLDDFADGFHFVVRSAGVPAAAATKVLANLRLHHGAGYFDNAEISWLPEGFTYRESRYNWYVKYQDREGRWLWVYLYDGAGSLHVDTEGAEYVEDVSINGNEGLCVVKNGYVHVVTTDLAHNLYIDVIASDGLSVTTVNRVVEHIRILP